jgi:hypothetical protein
MSSGWSAGERSEPERQTDDTARKIGYVLLFAWQKTRNILGLRDSSISAGILVRIESEKVRKMDDSGKCNVSIISVFRRYWWVFAVIVAVIVLTLFRVATVRQDAESNLPASGLPPLAQPPADEQQPEATTPPVSNAKPTADNSELPYPQDVEGLARYHGANGRKNIGDAEVFWQKGADNFIDFISKETFEQGIYRTYIPSELWWASKGYESTIPSHPDIIRLLRRTRRFSKLVAQVITAREQGNVIDLVETISRTISRFVRERRTVEGKIMSMIEAEPDAFTDSATREQSSRLAKLTSGVGSTGFEVVEPHVPMSLRGTELGVVASVFLLGLSEQPAAIAPIMEVLAYDDKPIVNALCAACYPDEPQGQGREHILTTCVFANRAVVADALDRILVACADNEAINQEAMTVARQYRQWRDGQDLPDREIQQTFTFDSPTTPYHLPGAITGVKEGAQTYEFELPVMLWEKTNPNAVVGYRLNEDTIGTIIDWGERFNATLKAQ